MSNNPKFPKGLMVKAPHENAPDFVKASISIKVAELQEWLSTKQTEWVNLDVKVSKEGKWYTQVNDWKPEANNARPQAKPKDGDFEDSDIPF